MLKDSDHYWEWLTEMSEEDFSKFYEFFNYFGTSAAGGVLWAAQLERERRKASDADSA